MTSPSFPLVWDNSMRKSLVSCPRKWAWEYLDHYKPRLPSIDLHAGKSWASAMEAARVEYYLKGGNGNSALEAAAATLIHEYGDFDCPPESAKSLARLGEALIYYFDHFPLASDPAQPFVASTGPMIEFSFVLPLDPDLLHPISGEPLLYSGRADMVATYAGAVTIYDDKTTSSLGARWAQQWDLAAQFTGYCWAAQTYGIPATQVLIRGISILKTKLDHAQALSTRSPWRVERWRQQVIRDIRRAMEMWKEGFWDTNESDACSAYRGCIFKQPCMSPNPQPWLDVGFIRRAWDPVTRTETIL